MQQARAFAIERRRDALADSSGINRALGHGDKGWIEHDSDLDTLRQEPRYLALVRAM